MKKTLLRILLIVAIFAFIEVIFRVAWPPTPALSVYECFNRPEMTADDVAGWRASIHPRLQMEKESYYRLGRGVLRIAIISDGCGFSNLFPWPEHLSRMLKKQGHDATVYNTSTPGFSSDQGVRVLEDTISKIEPSIAIFMFGRNDGRQLLPMSDKQAFGLLLNRVGPHSVNALRWAARKHAGGKTVLRVDEKSFEANLLRAVELCKDRGVRLILPTIPENSRNAQDRCPGAEDSPLSLKRYNETIRKVGAANGILFALDKVLANKTPPPETFFFSEKEDCFSEVGSLEVGAAFADYIVGAVLPGMQKTAGPPGRKRRVSYARQLFDACGN